MAVRINHDMTGWLKFFLYGLQETAEKSIHVFKAITALTADIEREKLPLLHFRKQANTQKLMDHLYQHPIVSIKQVANILKCPTNTARSLITDFIKLGVLNELTGKRRNRLFIFEQYFKIFISN